MGFITSEDLNWNSKLILISLKKDWNIENNSEWFFIKNNQVHLEKYQ